MKPVKLRIRWSGIPPLVGQFLKTLRGRTAYEITGIDQKRRAGAGTPAVYNITAERWNPKDLPEWATVWEFTWDKRTKRK